MLDLGIDLNVWPWMWLGIGALFALIELVLLPGSFVILPFAVSAFVASIAGFYDVSIEIQWAIFLVGGGLLWFAMYRVARRWVDDSNIAPGVGAERLIGLPAIVTRPIDPDDTDRQGRVTVSGEVWGALPDGDYLVDAGTKVVITAVSGTRVIVRPSTAADPLPPPPRETGAP